MLQTRISNIEQKNVGKKVSYEPLDGEIKENWHFEKVVVVSVILPAPGIVLNSITAARGILEFSQSLVCRNPPVFDKILEFFIEKNNTWFVPRYK